MRMHCNFKTLSKIIILGLVVVFSCGSNLVEGVEPLRIVTNSDKYPADSGPFLSIQPVDGDWSTPYKLQSVKYVSSLPSDAYLNGVGYFSPQTGRAYLLVSDARTVYLPKAGLGIVQAVNQNLDRFGLGTVLDRQRQIDALYFAPAKVVDPSDLGSKLLQLLAVWVIGALVLALPVLVLVLGWRRLFQLFLVHEIGKTIRGSDDGRET